MSARDSEGLTQAEAGQAYIRSIGTALAPEHRSIAMAAYDAGWLDRAALAADAGPHLLQARSERDARSRAWCDLRTSGHARPASPLSGEPPMTHDSRALVAQLVEDAEEIAGWGAGCEAGRVRQAAATITRHRAALIDAGREAGAFLADNVSDDFLQYVPGEVRGRILKLQATVTRLEAENAALSDPDAVHVNMLRGGIARPSIRQIWHIYGAALLTEMPAEHRDAARAALDPAGFLAETKGGRGDG